MLALAATSASVDFSLATERKTVIRGAAGAYALTQATYFSQKITLKAGHMIFTDVDKTPLKMPSGRYALTYFIGDIVYADTHEPVPLSEVYDHHWIATSSSHKNQLCDGEGPQYTFGIGAESRNSPVALPAGYGYVVPAGTSWGANIHLLRTEGLAGANPHKAAKECNECYYAPGKGARCTPQANGTFDCCGEGDYAGATKCATVADPPPPRDYQLRYTFNYTREVSKVTPVQLGVIAAPDCSLYYPALRNDEQPHHHRAYEMIVPARARVVFATGHLHTGGLNISLSVNGRRVCTSTPRYGTTPGAAGDEQGYLVEMPRCVDAASGALELHKGDVLSVDAFYYVGSHDPRLLYSDGTHLNVMAYVYLAYARPEGEAGPDDEAFWAAHDVAADGEAVHDSVEEVVA